MEQTGLKELGYLKVENKENKIIRYENIQKRKEETVFNLFGVKKSDILRLSESIKACFEIVNDKDAIEHHADIIKECFEISCYILYDRQIMNEVIYKQKNFGIDYVADFLKYVLRVFVNRYNESPILTKNQCVDVKEFCRSLLKIKNSDEENFVTIRKISAKEIVEILKTVAI